MIDPTKFEPVAQETEDAIKSMVHNAPYPNFLGLKFEEIKQDYSRMRLPYRPEINQPAGIIHGGAIASLIDTSVVGALSSGFTEPVKRMVTIDMHVHYLDAGIEEDLIAHAAVRRRGRTVVYLEVDVVGEKSGKTCAHGELSYMLVR